MVAVFGIFLAETARRLSGKLKKTISQLQRKTVDVGNLEREFYLEEHGGVGRV